MRGRPPVLQEEVREEILRLHRRGAAPERIQHELAEEGYGVALERIRAFVAQPVCGARTRARCTRHGAKLCPKCPPARCRRPPTPGRTRCRLHGGATPRGKASPHFRHGRDSRYPDAANDIARAISAPAARYRRGRGDSA